MTAAADRLYERDRSPVDGSRRAEQRRPARSVPSWQAGLVRFVVYGAGSIGGVVGARLFEHGHDVVLIARGPHLEAIRSHGLRLQDPGGEQTLPIRAVDHPRLVDWRGEEVCLVTVKSQHSAQVFADLASVAPAHLPVVCLQNGVRNEYEALRRFANVYGVPVACPAAHLEPGVVQAFSAPVTGILDVGRFPGGADDRATAIAVAFASASFDARPIADLGRWKWRKLVTNLGNAVEAVCGPPARRGPIGERAAAEGEACLAAAGIDAATAEDDAARRADLLQLHPVAGRRRGGGSSWQSLARHADSIETDYLNGEIVLLGRLRNVPTPVNALLQRLAIRLVTTGREPGSVTPEDFDQHLAAVTQPE
jgi:2-dehydropantoate 2-reductase